MDCPAIQNRKAVISEHISSPICLFLFEGEWIGWDLDGQPCRGNSENNHADHFTPTPKQYVAIRKEKDHVLGRTQRMKFDFNRPFYHGSGHGEVGVATGGTLGAGTYCADIACAGEYADGSNGSTNIFELTLEVKAPLVIHESAIVSEVYDIDHPCLDVLFDIFQPEVASSIIEQMIARGEFMLEAWFTAAIKAAGYDSIVLIYHGGSYEVCVIDFNCIVESRELSEDEYWSHPDIAKAA